MFFIIKTSFFIINISNRVQFVFNCLNQKQIKNIFFCFGKLFLSVFPYYFAFWILGS